MSPDRDRLWADMIQFDHDLADRALDGKVTDPEAPPWYRDLRSMIHRSRGPAEADELVDEAVMVDTMRRVTLGARVASLPRRKGVRRVAQVVGIKAAAAVTTLSLTSVAAAAATGLVATVAATVVVPVINERVMPIIEDGIVPAATRPAQSPSRSGTQSRTPPTCERTDGQACGEWADDVASPATAPVPAATTTRLKRKASLSLSARSFSVRNMAAPMTAAMWRPLTESRWASPLRRIASASCSDTAFWSPVMSAFAIVPDEPGSRSRT